MREILYRGKAINRDKGYHRTNYKNGEWVYGLVTRLYDERFENLPAEMRDIDGVGGIEVDYKTVGQYTGLTDKNGKKIFEGDIVKDEYSKGQYQYFKVIYDERTYRWETENKYGMLGQLCNVMGECEVIGNIHNNPELLGDK